MVAERHRTGWDHAGPSKTRQLCKGKALLHWETQVCLKNAGSFDAAPASPRAPARRRPCLRRPKRARCSVRMPNRSFEIAIRYLYTVFSVSRGKTSPIKRPRVRQDETHIIVQGTRHVLSRRPCIYTGGKIEDAKDFCLNRLAVFRRGRAGPARAGLPRGVDRAAKEVSGLPPARGACWQARVLIKTWAARPARHRRARRGPRGRVARPSARR